MSASDHLSEQQFWPIQKVGELTAGDSRRPGGMPQYTVDQFSKLPKYMVPDGSSYAHYTPREFGELKSSIRDNGVQKPLEVSETHLLNGHTRYRAAKAAGVTELPVKFRGDQ
jgi:hypothetical protein